MAERNDEALDLLDSFLERNKEGLAKAKKENPMLHNVILDAVVLLNKRFGNQDIDKNVIIEQTKVEEPVEEQAVIEEEVLQTPLSEKSTLDFNVGDKFYHNGSKKDIYIIDEINQDTVIVDTNYGFTHYNLADVIRFFNDGVWIKLPNQAQELPHFDAGDRFSSSRNLSEFYEIESISGDFVQYVVHNTDKGISEIISDTTESINSYIDKGFWVKYTNINKVLVPNIDFKVGDKFYHASSKKNVYTIIDITKNNIQVDSGYGNVTYELDEAINYFTYGTWIKLPNQSQAIPTPTPKPKQKTAQGTSSALKKKADRLQKDIKEIEDLLADGLLDNDQETQDDLKKMKDDLAEILTKI